MDPVDCIYICIHLYKYVIVDKEKELMDLRGSMGKNGRAEDYRGEERCDVIYFT